MQSPSSKSPRKIGVFKFKNIGDVVLMTPALQALHENFPQAEIHVMVNEETAPVLWGNPAITSVISYRRLKKGTNLLHKAMHELAFLLQLRRQHFDLTIDYDRGHRSGWYGFLCSAREHWTYKRFIDSWQRRFRSNIRFFSEPNMRGHQVDWHLKMLREAGLKIEDGIPLTLRLQPADVEWAAQVQKRLGAKRLVVVHPIARWIFKRWDPAKMATVIDWLQNDLDCRVVISNGGAAREMEKLNEITAQCRTPVELLASGTTLGQLAALIARSDCFLGIDTGPMHIAAAVGTPVVALFGPTHSRNWSPWCKNYVVLESECLCGPVETPPCQWQQVRLCMQSIPVASVQAALNRFLSPIAGAVR